MEMVMRWMRGYDKSSDSGKYEEKVEYRKGVT